jgi:hypothetical protein
MLIFSYFKSIIPSCFEHGCNYTITKDANYVLPQGNTLDVVIYYPHTGTQKLYY